MSTGRLWLFLAVGLPVLASLLATMSTVDLAYHLRAGSEILVTGAIPTEDTWTFTAAGTPWVDQQWAAQIVLALVDRLGGWTGLVLFRAALIAVIFGSSLLILRRRGLASRTSALLVLAAFAVAAPALALRPQLLGMVCFVFALVLVADRRRHPRRLWLVPMIVLVWANLHGSFFLGVVILGLAWLEDLHDGVTSPHRLLVVAAVSGVAACLTPFGPGVWSYALGLSVNPAVTARITEWQPTTIRDVSGLLFFASVAGIVAMIARRGCATAWPTLATLATFALIGLYAERGLAWWPLVAIYSIARTPILPGADRVRVEPRIARTLNAVVAASLVLAVVALLPLWRPTDGATRAPAGLLKHAPGGVTDALRSRGMVGQRILNPQRWGSWFEKTIPEAQVAIDSRIEMFSEQVWDDYDRVKAGVGGWQDLVVNWGVTVVVLEVAETDVRDRFLAVGWRQIYEDRDGVILVRS